MSPLMRKPSGVFYGWWIVIAATFITLYSGGVVYYGFTAFFEPLINTFGWSYTQISLAASLRGMETAFAAPLMGVLVDRWGPRRMLLGGAIIVGLGLMLLSRTTSLGMFYGAFILMGVGMSSCIGTVPMAAIANWFRRRIGIASGIVYCGFGFAGFLILVIVRLIDMFDWRVTVVLLGVGMWVIVVPLSLLVRHKPEQYGYLPDDDASNKTVTEGDLAPLPTADISITGKQALRSATFWHIALALTCHLIILNAVITHVMPYLNSIGIARSISSLVAFAIPLMTIIGRIGSGWLGDRLNKKLVTVGGLASTSLGLVFFSYISTDWMWMLIPFLIFYSIGHGVHFTMTVAMVREYFGRRKFGTIHGFVTGIMALGGMSGPLLAGWAFDTRGNYHPIWLIFACLAIVALVILATAPPVRLTTKSLTVGKSSVRI